MAEAWQPLAGVRVVDFSLFAPGPFAAAILADLGAEVLRIEPPAGDPRSARAPALLRAEDRNRRSLALDLEQEGSEAVVERLAAQADVVIEGFRPGVAERLGIDYATLSQHNARLIYCAVWGAGAGGSPAAIALLAALAERNRSGRGARLELPRLEAALRAAATRRGAAPGGELRAGEHSREVLVELGFDDAEIANLMKSGAVKAA